jgi:RNA polymerase sigma factor (TIGR02999 family)
MQLLRKAADGSRQAAEDLLPLLYGELRQLAAAWMSKSPPGHTLQPTALIHEAYIRLVGSGDPQWEGRRHFFFAAARAMRDILVEHARRKIALKRGGGLRRAALEECELILDTSPEEILAVEEALEKLNKTNSRMHTVVTLRYFAGLTIQETAQVLNVDASTVARDWRVARAWLFGQISGEAVAGKGGSP